MKSAKFVFLYYIGNVKNTIATTRIYSWLIEYILRQNNNYLKIYILKTFVKLLSLKL